MDTRKLASLLKKEPAASVVDELHTLVNNAADHEKIELRKLACGRTYVTENINSPVNRWVLYLLTLGHDDVDLGLLKRNDYRLHHVGYPYWNKKLRPIQHDDLDPEGQKVRDIALNAYQEPKKRDAQGHY